MPPQNNLAPVGLTRSEFNKYYWFTSLQMVTVVNPTGKDFPFMVEMRHYMVKKGEQESFVGPIANVYLNHMAKTMAQDDDQLELMADVTYMAASYKKLIVDVKNLAPEYDPTNNWQHRMRAEGAEIPPWAQAQASQPAATTSEAPPTPPWEQPPPLNPNTERASEVAQPPLAPPPSPPPMTPPPPKPTKPKDETKEFELNGITFKSVTKDGETSFFKNDKEISVADYNKAASMIA